MLRFYSGLIIGCILLLNNVSQAQSLNGMLPDSLLAMYNILHKDTAKISFLNEYVGQNFQSDPTLCLKILRNVQALSDRVGGFAGNIIAHNFSISHYQLSQWDSVIHYGQKALSQTDSIKEISLYGRILSNLSTTMRSIGETEKSNAYRLRARYHYSLSKDTLGLAIIDNDLGLYYFNLGQYARSMDHYQKALKGLEAKNHVMGTAIVLNNIGMIIHQQKDFRTSRSYYRRAYERSKEIDSQQNMGSTLNNIGSSYQDEGLLDSALHYHRLSLKIHRESTDYGSMAAGYNNIGIIYSRKKEYSKSLDNSNLAIRYARQVGNIQTEADAIIEAGKAQYALARRSSAIESLDKGLDLAIQINNIQLQQEALQTLYEIYRTDDPATSLLYLERATALSDSLLNEEKIRELTIKEKEYEFSQEKIKKEKEIALINAEAQMQKMQLARSRRNTAILLVVLLLGGIVTYTIILNRKKIQALNEGLQKQTHLLEIALKQKETLLKEIHHRVKNNLQVVSSLLGIQSRQVKDQAALEAIKAGRARVHSMALIHQDLYTKDHPTGIDLCNYFDKLVHDLINTYEIGKNKIEVHSDIDQIILDVDTVIPLGLILNELITNALKHAFPEGSGTIYVQMKAADVGFLLQVEDNGIGLTHENDLTPDSFGYDLIESLVDNMDGEWSVKSERGTSVRILLKKVKITTLIGPVQI